MTENLIIFNARVVTPIGFSARCGREMEEICIMDDATVEVTGGVITYVGPTTPGANAFCPALWTRIRTSFLAGSVPRSSHGA